MDARGLCVCVGAPHPPMHISTGPTPLTLLFPPHHQYIYGPLTNKRDYLDWFLDRITRGRPLPLPLHGDQLTTLTHVEDVAALLGAVVDNPRAVNQVFNCATDRCVDGGVGWMCGEGTADGARAHHTHTYIHTYIYTYVCTHLLHPAHVHPHPLPPPHAHLGQLRDLQGGGAPGRSGRGQAGGGELGGDLRPGEF